MCRRLVENVRHIAVYKLRKTQYNVICKEEKEVNDC